jgi:hypothetical protein
MPRRAPRRVQIAAGRVASMCPPGRCSAATRSKQFFANMDMDGLAKASAQICKADTVVAMSKDTVPAQLVNVGPCRQCLANHSVETPGMPAS